MIKRILVLFCLVFILVPNFVKADVTPEMNPLCWTAKECADERKINAKSANIQISDTEAAGGFVPNQKECSGKNSAGSDWGKCLAAGTTVSEIQIGGKSTFLNIGDYIKTIYNYLLGVASIVAVVMIIIAGIQWIVAAGSSEVISQAKKRISGALIGLVLAWSSFLILNTINPWLTNFRLPSTWMIKRVELMPEFCSDIQDKNFKLAAIPNGKKFSDLSSGDFKLSLASSSKDIICGNTFAPSNGGGATCLGDYCPGNYSCLPNLDNPDDPKAAKYKCLPAIAGGKVFNSNGLAGTWFQCLPGTGNAGWTYPWITHESKLVPICNNNNVVRSVNNTSLTIKDYNQKSGISAYLVNLIGGQTRKQLVDALAAQCSDQDGLMGFALFVYLDKNCSPWDMHHLIGVNGVDLGYEQADVITFTQGISTANLISSSTLVNGLRLNIDVNAINSNK